MEPPAGRDDQSKVSPPLARPPVPGAACAVLTGPADGILPLLGDSLATGRRGPVRPPPAVRSAVPPSDVRLEIAPYDYAAAERLGARARRLARHRAGARAARLRRPRGARARSSRPTSRHPLDAFGGLRDGAARILAHVERGSRITVHGDYDVDGVSATAVLVRALRTLGADVDWYLPSRIDDGYGLALATVERLAARGTELLVTVDCAITAVEEVAAARAAGHGRRRHRPPRAARRRPAARRADRAPGARRLPVPGAVRGGRRAHARPGAARGGGHGPRAADADLDVVALATVADCVPLVGENRRLVRAGLRALASTRKPGLQALMEVSRVDPSGVDAGAIGFRLAPRINAAGRLHRADAGLELLLTADVERARARRRRARRGQRRAPRRRDADPVRGRGAGRPRARRRRAGGLRAGRRRLASRA